MYSYYNALRGFCIVRDSTAMEGGGCLRIQLPAPPK